MLLLILCTIVAFLSEPVTNDKKVLLCYFQAYAPYRKGNAKVIPEKINPNICTHYVFAFAILRGNRLVPRADGHDDSLETPGLYTRFNAVVKKNPRAKSLLSVLGSKKGAAAFSLMASTEAGRSEFCTSSIKFLRDRLFQGLDIDWEFPGAKDKVNYLSLVRECRALFEKEARVTRRERLLLTAAVGAGYWKIPKIYDVPGISEYLDYINIMTYNLHGKWDDVTRHHAALYAPKTDTKFHLMLATANITHFWHQHGAPKSKIIVGMPLFGASLTLKDPGRHNLGDPITGRGGPGPILKKSGALSSYDICELIKQGAQVVRKPEMGNAPYGFKGSMWFSYDDEISIATKAAWIKQNGYAGGMVWSLDFDDFDGRYCGRGNFSMLSTLAKNL